MPAFARTIGIDYSGAETPIASLKGLRVYMAEGDGQPRSVAARTRAGAGGGLDIGRSRLDPFGQGER